MMFTHTSDKKMCYLVHFECSKVCYYQPKKHQSTPKILGHIFLQDQTRCALWHKNKYIHILQWGSRGGGGGKAKEM